jgi:hypothetical protein
MKHEATRVRRPIGPHTDLIAETLQCSFTVITVQIIEPPRKRWHVAGERAKVAGERAKRIAAYVLLRQKDRFDMRD